MRKSEGPKRFRQRLKARLLRHDRAFLSRGFSSLAGVDEAGKGPLAGPVVASAVIVRDFSFSARVDDSKKLTPRSRAKAYREILKKCWIGVAVVDVVQIDRLNILQASLLAMRQAVLNLKKIPDCVLVDGPHSPKIPLVHFMIINGDELSFSIACASVVAKVTRDRLMKCYDRLYPEYGFGRHKGYGTPQHFLALKKHGPCPIHRRSFEPVKSGTIWKLS